MFLSADHFTLFKHSAIDKFNIVLSGHMYPIDKFNGMRGVQLK